MPHIGCQLLQGCGHQTIESFVHALGISFQMTEATTIKVKFPLSLFGNSYLQEMVIQFTP